MYERVCQNVCGTIFLSPKYTINVHARYLVRDEWLLMGTHGLLCHQIHLTLVRVPLGREFVGNAEYVHISYLIVRLPGGAVVSAIFVLELGNDLRKIAVQNCVGNVYLSQKF